MGGGARREYLAHGLLDLDGIEQFYINYLTPLHFKGLTDVVVCVLQVMVYVGLKV